MTVVSSKEFAGNQERYLDMALNDHVYIQRGDNMFIVTRANGPARKYKEPDDDLRRAVSMEVVRDRLHEHVNKLFAGK
jgi:hypothetical protein